MRNLAQAGDTIVEVLISITVVSLVLGGAFVSASRSLNGTRQAQERVEALKLAEGQLERVKVLGKDASPTNPVYDPARSPFCIDGSNAFINPITPACDFGSGVKYKVSVSQASNVFTITVNWDRAGGGGTEQLRMIYRIYPD